MPKNDATITPKNDDATVKMLESEIPAETHFCGGSIISETVGISAAHCKMRVGTVDAVAGAHNIVTPEPDTQTVAVKDFLRQWFLL